MSSSVKTQHKTDITESGNPIVLPDYDAKIAEIAYFKAQSRNFEPGHELDDWFEAEREFLQSSASLALI